MTRLPLVFLTMETALLFKRAFYQPSCERSGFHRLQFLTRRCTYCGRSFPEEPV